LQLIVLQMTATLGLILLPFFLLLRMALNALDGMVAKHTNSCSPKGQVFNELGDVIADLFLFGGFLILLSNHIIPWALLMLLGLLIEFTSLALIPALGQRPNQGPFGKSDRAVYLGVLAVLLLVLSQSHWLVQTYIWIGIVLALLTFTNRLNLLEAN
ncbi:MAG: CDP-alcohol phosphatidyltransferase family protein, partial [Gammaproteobacteria bacterium]|nr:CDP-alcohol phosphatidyltransferase family protein [Gammaproteobacteria bacterium]